MTDTSSWYVYMVRCADSTFYTGITTNLARRIEEHNSENKGARYTRSRQPVQLVYSEPCTNRSHASIREYEIKKLKRSQKRALF